jgi:hypothetical protein
MKNRTLFLVMLVVFSAILIAGCTSQTTQPAATAAATPVPTTAAAQPTAKVAPVATYKVATDGLTGSAMLTADKEAASQQKLTGMRNRSFCEVITATADGNGALYGSAKLNKPDDACPEQLWLTLDSAQVMKQYNLTVADKNPPVNLTNPGRKFWALDIMDLPVSSNVRLFNGALEMTWWADVGDEMVVIPYNSMYIGRKSFFTFEKGNTVNLLKDPQGITWILKNYVTTPEAPMTYEQLPTLKTLLKYPAGWTFETKTLDKDLVLQGVNGTARIMWDDRDQSWDALDPGVANYQP